MQHAAAPNSSPDSKPRIYKSTTDVALRGIVARDTKIEVRILRELVKEVDSAEFDIASVIPRVSLTVRSSNVPSNVAITKPKVADCTVGQVIVCVASDVATVRRCRPRSAGPVKTDRALPPRRPVATILPTTRCID